MVDTGPLAIISQIREVCIRPSFKRDDSRGAYTFHINSPLEIAEILT